MANAVRDYFDAKVPVTPKPGDPNFIGPVQRTWQQGWNNLSRQLFVTLPNQLDRARVNRNKFLNAVK